MAKSYSPFTAMFAMQKFYWDLWSDSAETIFFRTPMIYEFYVNPSPKLSREMNKMVTEKMMAGFEGWSGMAQESLRWQSEVSKAVLGPAAKRARSNARRLRSGR